MHLRASAYGACTWPLSESNCNSMPFILYTDTYRTCDGDLFIWMNFKWFKSYARKVVCTYRAQTQHKSTYESSPLNRNYKGEICDTWRRELRLIWVNVMFFFYTWIIIIQYEFSYIELLLEWHMWTCIIFINSSYFCEETLLQSTHITFFRFCVMKQFFFFGYIYWIEFLLERFQTYIQDSTRHQRLDGSIALYSLMRIKYASVY